MGIVERLRVIANYNSDMPTTASHLTQAADLVEKMGEVLRDVQDAGCGYVNADKQCYRQCPSCGADAALKDAKDDWHAPDCKLAECLREINCVAKINFGGP